MNRKAVQRHMREMGIVAVYPGPNLSCRDLQHRIFPYLLRGVTAERREQIWGIDITYIRMRMGWMSLVAVIDWFSRYIIQQVLKNAVRSEDVGFTAPANLPGAERITLSDSLTGCGN